MRVDAGGSLTAAEIHVVHLLSDAMNAWVATPKMHPDEHDEMGYAIHLGQQLVMARAAMRAHPDVFSSIANAAADV